MGGSGPELARIIRASDLQIMVLHSGQQAVRILRARSARGKVRRQSGIVLGGIDSGRE